MDINMPEMDGVDATTAIRTEQDNMNQVTPIIALTGAALSEEKDRALSAGMNDFLAKPFSPTQLQEVVLKWTRDVENADVEVESKTDTSSNLATNNGLIDLSGLEKMCNGDKVFIHDMINIFLKDMPKATENMIADFERKDFQGVCDTAHRIKSNFMMLGMKEQQLIALSIEKMIKQNDINEALMGILLVKLKKAVDKARPYLLGQLK